MLLNMVTLTTHVDLHVSCPLFLSDFNKNYNESQILAKLPNAKFSNNPLGRSRVFIRRVTERQINSNGNRYIYTYFRGECTKY
jgi:hypothetical protein